MTNPFKNASLLRFPDMIGENRYLTAEAVYETPVSGGQYLLCIAASGSYAVTVNNTLAALGQFRNQNDTMAYDICDLTPFFGEGSHRIRIVFFFPGKDFLYPHAAPCAIYELFRDGGSILAGTKDSVLHFHPGYQQGPVELPSTLYGFSFLFREQDAGSNTPIQVPVCAAPAEKTPIFIRNPLRRLSVSEPAPCRILFAGSFTDTEHNGLGMRMGHSALSLGSTYSDICLPCPRGLRLSTAEGDGICLLLDLEKVSVGILTLEISLPCEAEVLIGWGNKLTDGRVDVLSEDRSFCASYTGAARRCTFTHPFLHVGLHYLEIHIYAKQAVLYYAGLRETRYPIEKAILFRCEDTIHNRIYDNCLHTLRMLLQPYHEPPVCQNIQPSPLTMRVQMLCGYLAFHSFALAYSGLFCLAQTIGEDGLLTFGSNDRPIPFYSAVFLLQASEYLSYSGDSDGTEALLPVLLRIAEAFIGRIDPKSGLLQRFPDNTYRNFYERQCGLSGEAPECAGSADARIICDAPLHAILSAGLHALHDILMMLPAADEKEADRFEQLHLSLNRALDIYFWDEEAHCYATYRNETGELSHYCELTNSLVLCAGAAQSDRLAAVIRLLTEPQSPLLPITPVNRIFKYEALLNRSDKCGKSVFSDIRNTMSGTEEKITATHVTRFRSDPEKDRTTVQSTAPLYCYLKYGLHMLPSMTGLGQCSAFEAEFCETPPFLSSLQLRRQ